MTHFVFVYGTLKRGQPNHHVIAKSNGGTWKLIGPGQTQKKWPLVIATKCNLPFLLDKEGEGCNVVGEVYEVDDIMFAELDELEGYPGFYDRKQINVKMDETESRTVSSDLRECWVYMLTNYSPFMADLERHANYDTRGAHGMAHVHKSQREEGHNTGKYGLHLYTETD